MRSLAGLGGVGLVAVVALVVWNGGGPEPSATGTPTAPAVPGPITAEVLNGTDRPGLARAVSHELRGSGIDVVYYGNAGSAADTTLVIARGDDTTSAVLVQAALGVGAIRLGPDRRRYVDVSVVLGADFPSRANFHP